MLVCVHRHLRYGLQEVVLYGGPILNFKSLEIVGFKSFADPIKITFEDGITAIVGPNGCGKSNVADAISWVLGEQSSKNLRASNMQDVIFKGTEKRKSLSFCEVTLCFDNTNKIFKSDFDEISITRKLYRSGDSEYMLNGATCRLKDITELIRDSGIGKGGYSIIGQGRVEKIINSKPEDRRAIFEEAAGIAKFKDKKVDAERKLERAQDNLNRVKDVMTEIERRLGPLKKQSENAKKYLELKEQLKVLEVNSYIYQYDSASDNKQVILDRINALADDLEVKSQSLDKIQASYNENFEKISSLDSEVAKLHEEQIELRVELEKQAGKSNLINERMSNLEQDSERLKEEYQKINQSLEQDKNTLDTKIREKTNLQTQFASLEAEIKETEERYNKIVAELQQSENDAEEAQKRIFDALNKLGDVKAKISALETEKVNYQNNVDSLNEQLKEYEERVEQAKQNKTDSQKQADEITKQINNEKINLDNLINKQNELTKSIRLLEGDIGNDTYTIKTLEQKKKILEDMIKEFEGYQGSVKRLLIDAEKAKILKDKMVGVFASLIDVPAKYQTAIEMALGSTLQNIITYDENGAKDLIGYLKQREYGRVTFLPLTSIKPRYFDSEYRRYLNTTGCFGLASELVSYDKSIANIVSSFLGTTVIVDNINTAVLLAKQSRYAFKIVTLEGDIINPLGSMTGGSRKQIANILGRENDVAETTKLINDVTNKLAVKQQQYNKMIKDQNQLVEDVKLKSEQVHNLEISRATKLEQCEKFAEIYADVENECNKCRSEIDKSLQILESIETNLSNMSSVQTDYDNSSNGVIQTTKSEHNTLKIKRDEYNSKLLNDKIELARINGEIISCTTEIDRLNIEIANNSHEKQYLENEILKNNDLAVSYKNMAEQSDSVDIKEMSRKLNETKAQLRTLEETKKTNQESLRRLEEQRMSLSTEVSRLQEKKYQQEMALAKIDTDIETMQERVWTEYELTYTTALPYKKEYFDIKAANTEISRLKKEISMLGYINVNAIEDYKNEEEHYGTYYKQYEDGTKASEDLKKIIKDLSNEMIIRFQDEFKKINDNFGIVFKELFGGGKAKLELSGSDDILEAGVDIIAEPPGKKLSNITLLSGGEKALTAIAILLAILRLRPMPFCLLDEIEAALDEANVDRFANYIKRFSDKTQFIVITHKKPTMEHADNLYGVTMEEKGVSKIVSVKLADAVKNVEGD